MHVNSINSSYKYKNPLFGINIQSKKLKFNYEDFYVNIKGYGKNQKWANIIRETADSAAQDIRSKLDFDSILIHVASGVKKANQIPNDKFLKKLSGVLRINRDGWEADDNMGMYDLITRYSCDESKYKPYSSRFDKIAKKGLKNPYYSFFTTKFMLSKPIVCDTRKKFIKHADSNYINNSLNMVKKLYCELHTKYIEQEPNASDVDDINSIIAEIRWIIAHSTPWLRGSDSIGNVFIRSIYKAIGVKTSPLKKGVSLDLEAYCTNLEDYKKNFSSYFTRKPYIVK